MYLLQTTPYKINMVEKPSVKKNVILNMLKQACSILFPLITFPYASRVLGSTYFGKINFSRSIVNYFLLLAALGINSYAIREGARLRNDKKRLEKFVSEIFSINVITTFISFILLGILILFWKKTHNYIPIIAIQSLIILFSTIGSDWINSIFEDFQYLTIRYIVIQAACLLPLFIFVRSSKDYLIYTLILVFSGYGGNLFNIIYIRKYVRRRFTLSINWRKHLLPILILFSSTIAVQIYLNSDITMLGAMKSDSETGIYSAVTKIYTIIKELINAITIVIIPRISSMMQKKNIDGIEKISNDTVGLLFSLILPLSTGLFLLSGDVINIVNGADYISGSNALRILTIALPFAVLSCYLSNALLVPFRKEKQYLVATISAAGINFVLNLLFIPIWGMNGAAITTLVAEAVVFSLAFFFVSKEIKIRVAARDIYSSVVGCIAIIIICLWARNVSFTIFRIAISFILSLIVYIAITVALGNKKIISLLKIKLKDNR